MNAEVWLNGQSRRPSIWLHEFLVRRHGQGKIRCGQCDCGESQERRREQSLVSGSGIYRHVWLKMLDPTHIAQWGTYITTPEVNASSAQVEIKTNVLNERQAAQVSLVTKLVDSKGQEVGRVESSQTIGRKLRLEFQQRASVKSPSLWSPDSPVLYTAISEVIRDGQTTDQVETKFGIRTISFDVAMDSC